MIVRFVARPQPSAHVTNGRRGTCACWSLRALVAAWFFCGAGSALEAANVSLIDINSTFGSPASPDANGNFWSTLATIGSPVALVDKLTNAPTGASLMVTQSVTPSNSGFTGSLVETGPAPGEFNIAEAFQDGWYDNTPTNSIGTFSFSGLDPTKSYTLTLWGNRDANWSDGAVSFTSGSVGGGPSFTLQQDALLPLSAIPSAAGALSFRLDDTSAGNTQSTVLNVMRLEEVSPAAAPPERSISVNFGITLGDGTAVNFDETAVNGNADAKTVAGGSWNNVLLQTTSSSGAPTTFTANTQGGNSLPLLDDAGLNAARLTSTGSMFSNFANTSDPNQTLTGDAGLFRSFLNLGGATAPGESITVSDLGDPFVTNGYDVVVFFDIAQDRTYGLTVSDGLHSETFWVTDPASPDADVDNDGNIEWVRALGTTEALATVGANYAVFSGFQNSSFTITGLGNNGRAAISGFQIIAHEAVPEPSSVAAWTLLGLFAAGLAIGQRRQRRRPCEP